MWQKLFESICVAINASCILGLPIIAPIAFAYALLYGTITRYLVIVYLISMFYDIKHNEGVRVIAEWYRNCFLYTQVVSYFPIKTATTVDIPEDQNYIIGIHPHGVLTYSAYSYFTKPDELKKIFGKGTVSFCTATYNMRLPIQRDFFRGNGSIPATEPAITRRLTSAPSGNHCAIVLGGAEEALITSHTEHRIILQKRKGFCRIALKTGSHLLPSYAYGQNLSFDIYTPPKGSFIHQVQKFVLNNFQVGVPILKGKWKYQYFLTLPNRAPITTVYGKPIPVNKVENPTREQVNELHEKYIKGLMELFESTKETYLGDKNAQLIIE